MDVYTQTFQSNIPGTLLRHSFEGKNDVTPLCSSCIASQCYMNVYTRAFKSNIHGTLLGHSFEGENDVTPLKF